MTTVKQIEDEAIASGFEYYSDFAHPDRIEHQMTNILTLICIKGKYNGDVIDVWYKYDTGEVIHTSVYSQFHNTKPTFTIK